MRTDSTLARGQEGFTLIETVMATAIAALLLSALAMAIHQFGAVTRLHSGALTVNQQVQTAATLLNRDIAGAADGVITEDDTLTLYVPAYAFGVATEPITRAISYAVQGQDLVRRDGEGAMVVARHVSAIHFGDPGPVGPTIEMTMTVNAEGRQRHATLQFHRRPG